MCKKEETQNAIEIIKSAMKNHQQMLLTDKDYPKKVKEAEEIIKTKLLSMCPDYEKN